MRATMNMTNCPTSLFAGFWEYCTDLKSVDLPPLKVGNASLEDSDAAIETAIEIAAIELDAFPLSRD